MDAAEGETDTNQLRLREAQCEFLKDQVSGLKLELKRAVRQFFNGWMITGS